MVFEDHGTSFHFKKHLPPSHLRFPIHFEHSVVTVQFKPEITWFFRFSETVEFGVLEHETVLGHVDKVFFKSKLFVSYSAYSVFGVVFEAELLLFLLAHDRAFQVNF